MKITFHKYHGLGNDYVYVDAKENECKILEHFEQATEYSEWVKEMSERRFGIGADGVIVIAPALEKDTNDARMLMFNADVCTNIYNVIIIFLGHTW